MPLEGNHELHFHARSEIGSKLKPDADDVLEEATERLESSDCSKWKSTRVGLGLVLFGLALLGLSASMWIPQRHIAKYMLHPERFMTPTYEAFEEGNKLMVNRFRGEDQMLIGNQFDRLRALHPSEPKYYSPGFEYELQRIGDDGGKSLLAKLEHMIEIDPDNGWWPFVAADVISRKPYLVVIPPDGLHLDWLPEDQAEMNLPLQLYHKAASSPRFDSYQTAINSRKIATLPPADNVQDSVLQALHIRLVDDSLDPFSFLRVLEERAKMLEDQRDVPNFKILLNDWTRLNRAQAKDFNQLNDLYRRTNSFGVNLPTFIRTAKKLGLQEEALALEKSKAALDQLSGSYPTNAGYQKAFRFHGSILTSWASTSGGDCGMVGDYFEGRYPLMTIERLKPNRRSEHAYIAQLLILPLGLLLLLATTVLFLFRFRNGRLCRALSGRLADLFDRSDWLHYVGFGVLLPIFYFAVIRFFTPFGGLDWNWGSYGHYLERARFVLLFLLMVSCSLLVLRRRLRERMSFVLSPERKARIGVFLTIAGFAALPLLGSCIEIERDQFVRLNMAMIYPALLAMGALLIWQIAIGFRFLFGSPEQALRRQILSRLMVRTMIWAFAIVCCTIPLHMAEERFWVKRDTVLRADPEHPARTRYEWEVIQQMKGELLEVLAPLEAIPR